MWLDKLQDEKFKSSVMDIFEGEVVLKFAKRQGDASEFYDLEGENEAEE